MAFSDLSDDFYDDVCPEALPTIKRVVEDAVRQERRMGASLLRLHFHDCFHLSTTSRSKDWTRDLVALSRYHTLGFAFRVSPPGIASTTKLIDSTFASRRQANCHGGESDSILLLLILHCSFRPKYLVSELSKKGILHSIKRVV
ncbi:hypothetical protein HAX54_026498 [Datura stramonium]|uniref:peroxidase n=1 Tax=Datura stramonium TaxID=4076 RepID=A0ABS8S7V8_DATST|nr:hypothetical protein [Datura stramonium]